MVICFLYTLRQFTTIHTFRIKYLIYGDVCRQEGLTIATFLNNHPFRIISNILNSSGKIPFISSFLSLVLTGVHTFF